MSEQHGRNGYLQGCRCDVCRAGQREYIAAQRARKRALRPVPSVPAVEPETVAASSTAAAETVGPVVAAVQAELAALGDLTGRQGLAAAAVAMARILDHPGRDDNPDDVKASVRSLTLEGVEATVWRAHLLTTKALAVVEVRFEAGRYTRYEEQRNRGTQTPTPHFSVKQAWVRPLNKIVAYEVSEVPAISDGDWFPVSATVRFRDLDDPVELPAQAFTDGDEERERSDEFLRELRAAIPAYPGG